MRKFIFSASLTAFSILSANQECDIQAQPQWIDLRHVEANGVGYNQGYSTLEWFLTTPGSLNTQLIPFLDLRGHIFNDGKLASNIGLGLRRVDSVVWGFNAYYDFRQTKRHNYNQVSLGFEALGKIWDFRWNGYLPVGEKHSRYYSTTFDSFEGNSLYISRKREIAMGGTNAEVGAHFDAGRHVALYAAAGPYYFSGEGRHTFGGEGRLFATIYENLGLQVSGSYDSIFKGIVQGEVSIRIPLGGKKKVTKRDGVSCKRERALRQRAYQRVDRNEIIVASHKRKTSLAINPATGLPWVVWFVDNTSHSLGTAESPFNQLVDAQNASGANDAIYVLGGDGTDTGQSSGITLLTGQSLFGGGTAQTLATTVGNVVIPVLSGSPLISNRTSAGNVVTLAANTTVAGLTINETKGNAGVYGTGNLEDILLTQNAYTTVNSGDCIDLVNFAGIFVISNSTFTGLDNTDTTAIDLNGAGNALNALQQVANDDAYVRIHGDLFSAVPRALNATTGQGGKVILVMEDVDVTPNTTASASSGTISFTVPTGSDVSASLFFMNNKIPANSSGAAYSFVNETPSLGDFDVMVEQNQMLNSVSANQDAVNIIPVSKAGFKEEAGKRPALF